ncbi:MAG TPA: DUF882 domain-containing protein [Polyangia bacterium]|jgi:uncharacterized protein YcbK (DUF882 family)|nr:DUF882 domain-containing protein [Polyangia bacterium]
MKSSSVARFFLVSALVLLAALESPARAAPSPAAKPAVTTKKPALVQAGKKEGKKAGKKAGKKTPKKPRTTTVVLFHVNRHDTFTLRQRDLQGRLPKGYQKRFDRFLRCHYTNQQHAMNPRLVRMLYQTGRHWPGKRLDVVSGYRSPSVAKNPHSPHMKGLAVDFHVEGVPNTALRDYLRGTMKKAGVGYYPNSSFVHMDVRKDRSAFWIDYSGPGERAVYSQAPAQDLKTGRAESYHPTKIGEDWVNDPADHATDRAAAADDEASTKTAPAAEPKQPASAPAPAPPTVSGPVSPRATP